MKKLIIIILGLALNLHAAPAPTHIWVERVNGAYEMVVYGRLKDVTQTERIYVKDPAQISKIAGMDVAPEFALTKSPIRFWIHFADGTNSDKAEGEISQIDFHVIDTFVFSVKTVVPTAQSSKDVVADIKAIIDAKPVDK